MNCSIPDIHRIYSREDDKLYDLYANNTITLEQYDFLVENLDNWYEELLKLYWNRYEYILDVTTTIVSKI